jgi:FkbM family methyltransferase
MSKPAILDSERVSIHAQPRVEGTKRPVIFDVGMNNGDDSAHYLSKGYQVVAIEANPILVERARLRFHKEIASGHLSIEHVGIVDRTEKIPFWVSEERDEFSSFDRSRASRDGMKCYPIDVECVTFDTILRKYGVPHYLKIDAEGAEPYCLRRLQSSRLPDYISVEAEKLEYLLLLWQLGYRRFKIVDQMRHNSRFPDFSNDNLFARSAKRFCWYADRFRNRFGRVRFPRGSSGPSGDETAGDWQTFEQVAYNWLHLHFGYGERGSLNRASWYDFHANASPAATTPTRPPY